MVAPGYTIPDRSIFAPGATNAAQYMGNSAPVETSILQDRSVYAPVETNIMQDRSVYAPVETNAVYGGNSTTSVTGRFVVEGRDLVAVVQSESSFQQEMGISNNLVIGG